MSISKADKPSVSGFSRAMIAELGQLLYVLISDFKKARVACQSCVLSREHCGSPAVLAGAAANVIGAARFGMRSDARCLAVLLATLSTRQDETAKAKKPGSILNTQLLVPASPSCSRKYRANQPRLQLRLVLAWLIPYHPRQDGAKGVIEGRQRWRSYLVSSSLMQSVKIVPTIIYLDRHNLAC